MKRFLTHLIISVFFISFISCGGPSVDERAEAARLANQIDSTIAAEMAETEVEVETKAAEVEDPKWNKTKAGKIRKEHPEWTKEECELVAENRVWIGMTLEMLKYERGLPNSANPSNYGRGVEWQWCWHDLKPSCFYGQEDEVIRSYN